MNYIMLLSVSVGVLFFCALTFFTKNGLVKDATANKEVASEFGRYSVVFKDGSKHTIIGFLPKILKAYPIKTYKRIH